MLQGLFLLGLRHRRVPLHLHRSRHVLHLLVRLLLTFLAPHRRRRLLLLCRFRRRLLAAVRSAQLPRMVQLSLSATLIIVQKWRHSLRLFADQLHKVATPTKLCVSPTKTCLKQHTPKPYVLIRRLRTSARGSLPKTSASKRRHVRSAEARVRSVLEFGFKCCLLVNELLVDAGDRSLLCCDYRWGLKVF